MERKSQQDSIVLLVDNDPIVYLLIKEILGDEDYKIIHINEGKVALEKVHEIKPDLILLDIMMPEMDGFEVCRNLQANPVTVHIPVIFISAKDDEDSYSTGFELGAIDYLTKPINHLDLKLKIRNYLKLSKNEQKLKESELRYKSIVEDQTDFILRILPNGQISYANSAFCNFIEKEFEEITNHDISDLVFTDAKDDVLKQLSDLNPNTLAQTNTRKIIFPDGRISWQQWIDRGIFNNHNKLLEYQIVGRDVTIQKKYEEAIRVITDASAGATGKDFFKVLLSSLVKLLRVDYALIGEFIEGDKVAIKTQAVWKENKKIKNFTLTLTQKGAEDLFDIGFLLTNNPTTEKYDQNSIVILEEPIPNYAMIPLFKSDKEKLGVLAVLSKETFKIDHTALDIIKIFSMRAAAELERDINEKKLRESELRYRMLADYNYDWEYWIGPDGKFLYVSPSCERITGYTSEEFMSRPELITEITHPDHKDKVEENLRKQCTSNHSHEMVEYKIIDKRGKEKWINQVCNPVFDNNNKFRGSRGNNRDITSKKKMENAVSESEKKFRNIFQNSMDGMIISDLKRKLLETNFAFQRHIGMTEEDIINKDLTNYIHPGDIEIFKNWFKTIGKDKPAHKTIEIRLKNLEEQVRFMEINSTIIKYHNSKALLFLLRDITERKEVHAKILNTIIETEDKERRRFAQDLHDGMGPLLSTIKLYTRSILTAKDKKNKEIAIEKALETIDDAIKQIKEISFNISPSILKDFGLIVAVKSYVKKFNDTKKVNINFKSGVEKRFPSNIEASLFRVVIELINNTVKHSHANNVLISIDYSKKHLIVNYSDDGIGFELNKVMEKSTGQGLFNMINRIKSLGGEIDIDTDINQGFNVTISINIS